MQSLLGGNGFERSRRACLKSCLVGWVGLITSKSILPFSRKGISCGSNPSPRKHMQGFLFERACHDVPTIPSRGQWGALCHWKDLWQEETVRIVTQRLASRAKQLPEATYANDR